MKKNIIVSTFRTFLRKLGLILLIIVTASTTSGHILFSNQALAITQVNQVQTTVTPATNSASQAQSVGTPSGTKSTAKDIGTPTGSTSTAGEAGTPGSVSIPGEAGGPGSSLPAEYQGQTAVKIQVVRYSYAGAISDGTGSYTPVGGVNFTLSGIARPRTSQAFLKNTAFAQTNTPTPVNKITETIYTLTTPIIDDTMADDIRRFGERVFTSAVGIPKLEGIIPDDGVTSAIIIPNLPSGDYQLQVSKSNFKSRKVKFSIGANLSGLNNLEAIKIEPSRDAPPPSISANSDIYSQAQYPNFYFADAGEITYAYHSSYPWLGWQPKDNFINLAPQYPNPGEPVIVNREGYPDWGEGGVGTATDRCKSIFMQTGQKGINATAAALGAVASYILPRLGPNNGHVEVGDAALTGITAYLAAKAFGQPGTTISYDDCGGIYDNMPWQIPPQCTPYYGCDGTSNCGYRYPSGCQSSGMSNISNQLGFPVTGGSFNIAAPANQ